MKHSEAINEIAVALTSFTTAIGPVVKTQTGKIEGTSKGSGKDYSYEYHYADLSSQREHVREALGVNGLTVTQSVGSDGDSVIVETLLMHTSGQWLEADPLIIKTDGKAQSMGSAMTYGRRYQYQGILGIAGEEDDDGKAANESKPKSHAKDDDGVIPNGHGVRDILKLRELSGYTTSEFNEKCKVALGTSVIKDMTDGQRLSLANTLRSKITKAGKDDAPTVPTSDVDQVADELTAPEPDESERDNQPPAEFANEEIPF